MYLCALYRLTQYVLKSLLSCKTRNQAYSWELSWVTQGRDAWQMNPYVFSTLFLSLAIHSFCKVFVNYLLWIRLFPFPLMTLKSRVGFSLSWQLAIIFGWHNLLKWAVHCDHEIYYSFYRVLACYKVILHYLLFDKEPK